MHGSYLKGVVIKVILLIFIVMLTVLAEISTR